MDLLRGPTRTKSPPSSTNHHGVRASPGPARRRSADGRIGRSAAESESRRPPLGRPLGLGRAQRSGTAIGPIGAVVGQHSQHLDQVTPVDRLRPLRAALPVMAHRRRERPGRYRTCRSRGGSRAQCRARPRDRRVAFSRPRGAQERQFVIRWQHAAAEPIKKQGTRSSSASAPSCDAAPAQCTSLPTMNAGRSALRSRLARSATASGSGRRHGRTFIENVNSPADGPKHVEREVEERRSAMGVDREVRGGVNHCSGVTGVPDRARRLGDRLDDRNVVELLNGPEPQRDGRPPAEHDERRAVEVRRRHRGNPVGDARAGGEHGSPARRVNLA